MANGKKLIRVLKQTSHPQGLPCNGGCEGVISEDDPYTEEVMPSEQRRAYCEFCRPIHKYPAGCKRGGAELATPS